jgi:hypothetical protein
MSDSPLQQALIEIVKNIEETMTYLAAMEAALVENGRLQEGDIGGHLMAQKKKLANARSLISRVQF